MGYLVIYIIVFIIDGYIGTLIGKNKKYDELTTFVIGGFFGIIGWIYLACVSDKSNKEEMEELKQDENYKKEDEALKQLINNIEDKE